MPEKSHSTTHDIPMGEESPRLSTGSVGSNDRASTATLSDCSDFPDVQRPVSVVSTISSGSGSSREDVPLSGIPSAGAPVEDNVDLELMPAGNPRETQNTNLFLLQNSSNAVNSNRNSQHSSSPFVAKTMAPNPGLTYLDRVVMEILETERMYVRDLRSIVEDYLAHIIDTGDLPIGPDQVCALFGNIEDIYEFNSELLQSLDMCDNNPVAIARCFVLKREDFEIYTQYCTNYPNSVAALTDCMRNKTLAKFFRERQATLKRTLPLGSYLLKPVQRILKYHLLLQEIAKHFDQEEEGYEMVEEAIYTMTGVAWYINDMKRKHEHAVRLQEVQSLLINWKGVDLTTYGELVLEGNFRVHRAKNERTLFLFDRMLLITKRRGEHYVYKAHISCSTLMLIESAKDSLCFSVTHYKHPKQPHTVQAKTMEEKKLWAHHIKRLILENHQVLIPQKAKEAILEMDSIYKKKYRYSPERLKKSVSCQLEEFKSATQGRRQSESSKDVLKTTKAILKDEERHEVAENGLSLKQEEVQFTDEVNSEQIIVDKSQNLNCSLGSSDGGSMERLKVDISCDPESLLIDQQVTDIHDLKLAVDKDDQEGAKEEIEEPSRLIQNDDTPGESSEEEDDSVPKTDPSSILPSSVLDKASIIAEHFVGSARRSSVSTDEVRSIGCPSPRLLSRTGSTLSMGDSHERPLRLSSTCSETRAISLTQESFESADLTVVSPRDDCLFDSDRGIYRRRDSVLSRQDQLLIDKIRSYYDNAENQDATFSLKRRESLTYIPSGVVRNSVSRLNSIPKDKNLAQEEKTANSYKFYRVHTPAIESPLVTSTLSEPKTSANVSSLERSAVSASTDFTEIDKTSDVDGAMKPQSTDIQLDKEVFRPSSDMIKVWQDMEREATKCQEDLKAFRSREAPYFRGANLSLQRNGMKTEGGDRQIILEDSDLSTIREESSTPSPPKEVLNRAASENDANTFRPWDDESTRPFRPLAPRVVQLRAEADTEKDSGPQSAEDAESAQNKVIHLARKYSQRIKCPQPVLRFRSQDLGDSWLVKRNLLSVVEEKPEEAKGKPNLMLSLTEDDQADADQKDQVMTSSPDHTPNSIDSPKVLSPRQPRSRSPLSPTTSENFNWPDVRELCSKYAHLGGTSLQPQISQKVSRKRSSSTSTSVGFLDPSTFQGRELDDTLSRTQRGGSLDRKLGDLHLSELQKHASSGYYVSAQATLPNEKNIIVIEKVPEGTKQQPTSGSNGQEMTDEMDDGYVQIRSPTSREKLSYVAVFDRCRAFQESEEYRLREEDEGCGEEQLPKIDKPNEKASSSSENLGEALKNAVDSGKKADASQQSVVKNLREKFQNLR
ncbi:pleckstrin homology domain-containing family G member 3 isoform X2 [Misgurnus anguillicaudatus]|uniref:pleckstrin homology domain-containing family G member 3 isoform X2 n=1 Tax=Misgurnus anguillicaudatus TaxID=75329 RepID=UPI003CCF0140